MAAALLKRPLAVLRPEPGNAATAARVVAAGRRALRLPLFAVAAVAWDRPDPAAHDALLLTSANAVRHGGAAMAAYRALPVHAVGAATAAAARAAGFDVVATGEQGAAALAQQALAGGMSRALHFAGAERAVAVLPGVTRTVIVYQSAPLTIAPAALSALTGAIALVHSPRAGARLAELVADRSAIALAAISRGTADAAGAGWACVAVAPAPDDVALVATALALAD
ncbi:MAG: uroporphyrinogen-III synthase [Pseudomonadota bacterium]